MFLSSTECFIPQSAAPLQCLGFSEDLLPASSITHEGQETGPMLFMYIPEGELSMLEILKCKDKHYRHTHAQTLLSDFVEVWRLRH